MSSDNPTPDQGQAIDNNVYNNPIDPPENNIEVEEALPDNTNTQIDNNSENLNPSSDAGNFFQYNIFDPRYYRPLF